MRLLHDILFLGFKPKPHKSPWKVSSHSSMVCHFCARQLGRVEPRKFRKAISLVARFLARKWSDIFQSIGLAMISVAMDGGVEAGHLFQWMAAG